MVKKTDDDENNNKSVALLLHWLAQIIVGILIIQFNNYLVHPPCLSLSLCVMIKECC